MSQKSSIRPPSPALPDPPLPSRLGGDPGRGREIDPWIAIPVVGLVISGLVMVLSSSQAISYLAYHSSFYLIEKESVFAVLGFVAMITLSRFDYHKLQHFAIPAAVVALALMVAALLPGIGVNNYGAQRWINLGPLGTFQPSEFSKLAFTLFLAQWVARRKDRIHTFSDGFVPFVILLGVALATLALQRDLGTAVIMASIFVVIYFTGGGGKRWLLLLGVLLLIGFILMVGFEKYRLARLEVFFDPFIDPQGKSLQAYQALVGIGSGGITGVGLGHSVQKYQWLPQAHTDFIFAIVGEEAGLIGSTLMLAGFVVLAVRGYRASMRAPDRVGIMLAAGITTWISLQALINIGVVTDTLPITGVPLPFISYGGSALAVTMAAAGVLLNISQQGKDQSYLLGKQE